MVQPKDYITEFHEKIEKCKKLSELKDYSDNADIYEGNMGIKQVLQELRNHIFDKSVELFLKEYPVKEIKSAPVKKSKSKK